MTQEPIVVIEALEEVAQDKAMPLLPNALQPQVMQTALRQLRPEYADAMLCAIRVTRYKPGRRCVLEYDLQFNNARQHRATHTLIGKARRNRHGHKAYGLLHALRQVGFDATSVDGIAVPEPLGVIANCGIWLQQKVHGTVLTDLLESAEAPRLMWRVAEAAHKLHTHGGPALTGRIHTLEDEMQILRERLGHVAQIQPVWAKRLERLLVNCDTLATTLQPITRSIHRDFYPDQVIADLNQDRLWLIDFDLFCEGHPAIDIGNFIAHLTEQALRTHGDAEHYAHLENILCERYLALAGEVQRHDIRVGALLSLVRHISLSTEMPERQHLTADLLALCESRFTSCIEMRHE